jgi:phospholipase C
MLRLRIALLIVSVVLLASCLISLNACGGVGGNSGGQPPPSGAIKHIVIIFQENRTPDNLFQDPVLIARGADIASQGLTSTGQMVTLQPTSLVTVYDMPHGHGTFLTAWDNGAMDGADKESAQCPGGGTGCAPALPAYQYVQASDIQPYYALAETYAFGDRMFQTNQGPSFPAHQYIISGASAVAANSTIYASENPNGTGSGSGCLAGQGATVLTIDISQPDPHTQEVPTSDLCFEHATLTDLLDAANLSWKYYTPTDGSWWTAPDAINHMCGPNPPPPNATACTAAEWTNHVVIEGQQNQILNDIAADQLAAVSWVIPNANASDHAQADKKGAGPSWVAAIVNAIGTSQYWSDTAIVITWDDWGGWYDHVAPPKILNSYEYGFRVPLIVVSPYAKPAYVSHAVHDFGSILKFVETTFGLSTVGPGAGYADSIADDLSDCFNFSQAPLKFTPVAAKYGPAYFQNDHSPVEGPDKD